MVKLTLFSDGEGESQSASASTQERYVLNIRVKGFGISGILQTISLGKGVVDLGAAGYAIIAKSAAAAVGGLANVLPTVVRDATSGIAGIAASAWFAVAGVSNAVRDNGIEPFLKRIGPIANNLDIKTLNLTNLSEFIRDLVANPLFIDGIETGGLGIADLVMLLNLYRGGNEPAFKVSTEDGKESIMIGKDVLLEIDKVNKKITFDVSKWPEQQQTAAAPEVVPALATASQADVAGDESAGAGEEQRAPAAKEERTNFLNRMTEEFTKEGNVKKARQIIVEEAAIVVVDKLNNNVVKDKKEEIRRLLGAKRSVVTLRDLILNVGGNQGLLSGSPLWEKVLSPLFSESTSGVLRDLMDKVVFDVENGTFKTINESVQQQTEAEAKAAPASEEKAAAEQEAEAPEALEKQEAQEEQEEQKAQEEQEEQKGMCLFGGEDATALDVGIAIRGTRVRINRAALAHIFPNAMESVGTNTGKRHRVQRKGKVFLQRGQRAAIGLLANALGFKWEEVGELEELVYQLQENPITLKGISISKLERNLLAKKESIEFLLSFLDRDVNIESEEGKVTRIKLGEGKPDIKIRTGQSIKVNLASKGESSSSDSKKEKSNETSPSSLEFSDLLNVAKLLSSNNYFERNKHIHDLTPEIKQKIVERLSDVSSKLVGFLSANKDLKSAIEGITNERAISLRDVIGIVRNKFQKIESILLPFPPEVVELITQEKSGALYNLSSVIMFDGQKISLLGNRMLSVDQLKEDQKKIGEMKEIMSTRFSPDEDTVDDPLSELYEGRSIKIAEFIAWGNKQPCFKGLGGRATHTWHRLRHEVIRQRKSGNKVVNLEGILGVLDKTRKTRITRSSKTMLFYKEMRGAVLEGVKKQRQALSFYAETLHGAYDLYDLKKAEEDVRKKISNEEEKSSSDARDTVEEPAVEAPAPALEPAPAPAPDAAREAENQQKELRVLDQIHLKNVLRQVSHRYHSGEISRSSNLPELRGESDVPDNDEKEKEAIQKWMDGLVATVHSCEKRGLISKTGYARWRALQDTLGTEKTNSLKSSMRKNLKDGGSRVSARKLLKAALVKKGQTDSGVNFGDIVKKYVVDAKGTVNLDEGCFTKEAKDNIAAYRASLETSSESEIKIDSESENENASHVNRENDSAWVNRLFTSLCSASGPEDIRNGTGMNKVEFNTLKREMKASLQGSKMVASLALLNALSRKGRELKSRNPELDEGQSHGRPPSPRP